MTQEQIEKQIKNLQQKKKELQKKDREKLKKTSAKNDSKILALMKLFYDELSEEKLINFLFDAIQKKYPEKIEKAEKILNKK